MKLVGAALEGYVDRGSALDTVLGSRKLLDRVLGNGIVTENGSRNPQYAGLPNDLTPIETVVVRHAIDHVIVRGGALAAHADVQEPATWRALHSGCQGQDGLEITALGRQI